MSDLSQLTDDQRLLDLIDSITEKVQAGERPDLEDYVRRFPQYAAELKSLLPAILAVEDLSRTQDAPSMPAEDVSSLPNKQLGDFLIRREIDRGGMGIVYEAEQLSLRRKVALKVLPFAAVLDPRQLKRFKNEAAAAASLHHSNIVPVFGIGTDRGVHYYAMQYIEGQSLAKAIADLRTLQQPDIEHANHDAPADVSFPLSTEALPSASQDADGSTSGKAEPQSRDSAHDTRRELRAAASTRRSASTPYYRNIAELGAQVAEALDYAHTEGVIHRDIKPGNLILQSDGRIWITDFGLARLESDSGMTMTGDLIGTLRYMSPEQALAKRVVVDHRTDVYSLGATLYELLTLRPAFEAEDRHELLRKVAFDEPIPLRRIDRSIPAELETIVLAAMAKNPFERYATAAEMAADLRRYLTDEPICKRPPPWHVHVSKWCRRHRPLVTSTVAISLVGMLAVTVISVLLLARQNQISVDRHRVNQSINDALTAAAETSGQADASEELPKRLQLLIQARQQIAKAVALGDDPLAAPDLSGRAATSASAMDARIHQIERQLALQSIARDQWIPQAMKHLREQNLAAAFQLARQIEGVVPEEPRLREIWEQAAVESSISSVPVGAKVQVKHWEDIGGDWLELGTTPLNQARLPKGPLRWRFRLDGYAQIECVRELEATGELILELRAEAGEDDKYSTMVLVTPRDDTPPFWIDKFEVTNAAYQEFVDAGGYNDPRYWKHPFVADGKTSTFEEAMRHFTDRTNHPGPATWSKGRFPPGKEAYPVSGISWYEAAAFAEFKGKSLPTIETWAIAANPPDARFLLPLSNYGDKGPLAVGASPGIGKFGLLDMAGNVEEWCLTPAADGRRCFRGGAYNDPAYMFNHVETASPFDRQETIGFRCVIYDRDVQVTPYRDGLASVRDDVVAATEEEFKQMRLFYQYDRNAPFNDRKLGSDDSFGLFTHETFEIDAAYNGERFEIHCFWPKLAAPPYQTVVFFPGTGARSYSGFPRISEMPSWDWQHPQAFLAQGRAVVLPVYKGTFGRSDAGFNSHESVAQWGKDLFRTVDFLEQKQPNVDMKRLIYLGTSWGGAMAPIFLPFEDRFAVAVLIAAGLRRSNFAATDARRLAPFVKIPVTIHNGKDDDVFPYDTHQLPLRNALGSDDKEHTPWPGNHTFSRQECMEHVDRWLSTRVGPAFSMKDLTNLSPLDQAAHQESTANGLLSRGRGKDAEPLIKQVISVVSRELGPNHIRTMQAERTLATAIANQNRAEPAAKAYQQLFEKQSRLLGLEHDETIQTLEAWREQSLWKAFSISNQANASGTIAEDQARVAEQLALSYAEVALEPWFAWGMVADARIHLGDYSGAIEACEQSFKDDSYLMSDHLYYEAIARWHLRDFAKARAWYRVAEDYLAKQNPKHARYTRWKTQAGRTLGEEQVQSGQRTPAQNIEDYELLLEDEEHAVLHFGLGLNQARLRQWDQALASFKRAAELNPRVFAFWQAVASVSLYQEDVAGYQLACQQALKNRGGAVPFSRNLAILCCLGPSGIATEELEYLTTEGSSRFESGADHVLAQSLVRFRTGRLEEAVDSWQPQAAGHRRVLSNLYLAAASAQVGNAYTARRLRHVGHNFVKGEFSSPDGPELTWGDEFRPIYWCMVQSALREAEAVVPRKDATGAQTDPSN